MKEASITVIITVWKRGYLDEQLNSLINQTVRPRAIWIIQNESHINIKPVVEKYRNTFPAIEVLSSTHNLKYFGRFSLSNLVETEYIFVVDDDVIPSSKWMEICLDKLNTHNSVISCTGRIVKPFTYRPEDMDGEGMRKYFLGDNQSSVTYNYLSQDSRVDYGCNSYFIRKSWMQYFWATWPATFDSGEDIHLSASLMVAKGIPTFVPQQLTPETTGNLKRKYSLDCYSSWRENDFLAIRQTVFEYWINEKNWEPFHWKEEVALER